MFISFSGGTAEGSESQNTEADIMMEGGESKVGEVKAAIFKELKDRN